MRRCQIKSETRILQSQKSGETNADIYYLHHLANLVPGLWPGGHGLDCHCLTYLNFHFSFEW